MLFSQKKELTKYEYSLVNGFLSETIGVSKAWCCEVLRQEGFTILDDWESKLGCVKEGGGTVAILTLYFRNEHSHNFRLYIKNVKEKWADTELIDFTYLKESGVI